MNADPLIYRKIEPLIHCIKRIEQKRPDSLKVLEEAGIITENTAKAMQRAAGFRNLVVHANRKIDRGIIWNIINNNPTDFKVFIDEIT